MSEELDRRQFITRAAAGGAAWGLMAGAGRAAEDRPNEAIVVGVMGMGGRGTRLAEVFQKQKNTRVAAVCDVDRSRAQSAADAVEKAGGSRPGVVSDYRRILEDGSVDALVIATCDHWHAPAAIEACKAGKHVYVEKPCSHNPREGELLVEAARKHKRAVQMGNQRRSWPKIVEGIERLRDGVIGPVYYSRGWYANTRGSIGEGKPADPPRGLNYDLWQGPAPRRPFHTNYLHYNWHWFWNWGTGEAGNNGVHAIDLCRWGLGVDYPTRVTSVGGRYAFNDDQQTPDTHVIGMDFEGGKSAMWEGLSCNRHGIHQTGFGASFHGKDGTMVITGGGYTLYDKSDKKTEEVGGPGGNDTHVANFLTAIREGDPMLCHSEIEGGHKSTLLCHLGNIAHRTGRSLKCDPKTGRILDDEEAMRHWSREYAPGWEPKV